MLKRNISIVRSGLGATLAVLVSLAGLPVSNAGEAGPKKRSIQVVGQAHEFAYDDINPASPSFGKKLALAEIYAQQGVVLNFLASWCAPCWHEVPALRRMASEITTPVVCVAADEYGPPTDLLNLAARADLKLPIVLVPTDEIAAMEAEYDHGMLPTTYWIDNRGRILERRQGQLSEGALFEATRNNFPAGTE